MILPGCSSRQSSTCVPWYLASRSSVVAAMGGSKASICSDVIKESRPNSATNQGTPAAKYTSPCSRVTSMRRSSNDCCSVRSKRSLSVWTVTPWSSSPLASCGVRSRSPSPSSRKCAVTRIETRWLRLRLRRKLTEPSSCEVGGGEKRSTVVRRLPSAPSYSKRRLWPCQLGGCSLPRLPALSPLITNMFSKEAAKSKSSVATSGWRWKLETSTVSTASTPSASSLRTPIRCWYSTSPL